MHSCGGGGCCFFTGNRKPEVITGCPRFFILYLMRGRVHGDNPFTKSSRRKKEWVERRVHSFWGDENGVPL